MGNIITVFAETFVPCLRNKKYLISAEKPVLWYKKYSYAWVTQLTINSRENSVSPPKNNCLTNMCLQAFLHTSLENGTNGYVAE